MSRLLVRSDLQKAVRPLLQTWSVTRHDYTVSACAIPQHGSSNIRATRPVGVRCHSTSSAPISSGSSVSASEVTHFTSLASSWWDPHGPSRLLHLMNPLRHDFIQSCLATSQPVQPASTTAGSTSTTNDRPIAKEPETSQEKPSYTYLDIGCGGGIFASSAARLPTTASVTAIDPTPEVIKVAKAHQRGDPLLSTPGRLHYLNCAIEELEAHTETKPAHGYDFVTIFEVIEHIDKPAAFLRQALQHLRPGGWLVGSTIARHPVSYLTTKIVAEAPWPIGVVPAGTHDWNKYINPSEMKRWVVKENRELKERGEEHVYGTVKVEGCMYLPLLGWKFVNGSQEYGNYFFGVQRLQ